MALNEIVYLASCASLTAFLAYSLGCPGLILVIYWATKPSHIHLLDIMGDISLQFFACKLSTDKAKPIWMIYALSRP